MTSREARRTFVEFFEARRHRVVASSPLVLPGDPTLLFANAGMNQFKDVFTGREERDYRRAVSVQKCLRVSGKHNDLEMVGRTPRHHTFFEMLGNFSFGDYFKHEAIAMAWELLTSVYRLPPDRLWVTVFGGTDQLAPDEEALAIWRDEIGIPRERLLRLGEADNFWRMGDSGPCGPCSELHYDLGEDLTSVAGTATPENDSRRFMEVWNLVFMQFDQKAGGALEELPAPSIDTGMGLERIVGVLQDRRSNFDSDLFQPLLAAAGRRAGIRPGADAQADLSLRVIADHARALCFLVADGIVPANDNRGYVLRRLLRRAIRHGRKLGIDEPFLHEVTPVVIEELGPVYPELVSARDAILEVGRREEQRFAETLSTGLVLLEESFSKLGPSLPGSAPPTLPGEELFRLYDTYGLPLELARDMAEERGMRLDEAGFEAQMARQRERAQASWKGGRAATAGRAYGELVRTLRTTFEGYDRVRLDQARVLALLAEGQPVEALRAGSDGEIVLEATPFYAEAGGQVADTGVLAVPGGRAAVLDVQRPADRLVLHRVRVEIGAIAVGDLAVAEVDAVRRRAILRNHTGTHLLHAALREVVGPHVKQAGSLVAPDRLRFDFSHFAPLTDRALSDIESLVHSKVLEDLPVETLELDRDEALRSGAMALFGEKYGERVRVVRIGEFSLELCGGTHTRRTGEIGLLKLTLERGVASGVRRVEAVSGEGALERFRETQAILHSLEQQLSVSREHLCEEVGRRLEQLKALQRDGERERFRSAREQLMRRAANPEVVGGIRVIAERVDALAGPELRELADDLRRTLGSGVVILGRAEPTKVSVLVSVTEDLTDRLSAKELVREIGPIIQGGGGGRPELAEAGGKATGRLDEAIREAVRCVGRRMETTG